MGGGIVQTAPSFPVLSEAAYRRSTHLRTVRCVDVPYSRTIALDKLVFMPAALAAGANPVFFGEFQMETMPSTKYPAPTGSESTVAEHARRSLEEARAGAEDLSAQGSEAVQKGAAQAREAFSQTADQAVHYVQEQPLKALMMAAAAGAAIAMLAGAIGKHRHH
jgi:ElaB/YqjD/DUF883 family membrane-anchored ribosome-binding protein